jgi:hypothetical protein
VDAALIPVKLASLRAAALMPLESVAVVEF